MKGIIFTEFMEMVEHKFGLEMVDCIIDHSKIASEGAYTSVDFYPHSEMLQLVTSLSEQTNIPVDDLCVEYGKYLLKRFVVTHNQYFSRYNNPFDFLDSINDHIHAEVRKLDRNTSPPSIKSFKNEHGYTLEYRSHRGLSMVALGLIIGSLEHYGQSAHVHILEENESRTHVLFEIEINE